MESGGTSRKGTLRASQQADAAEPALPGRWRRPPSGERPQAARGAYFNFPGSFTDLIVSNSTLKSWPLTFSTLRM